MSRRGFLRAGTLGATGLALGLSTLRCTQEDGDGERIVAPQPERTPMAPPAYDDWRDVYQQRWQWDKVVRSTHFVNCWYQAACSWNVYVKDGIVWREEQVAGAYEQTNPERAGRKPARLPEGWLLQ